MSVRTADVSGLVGEQQVKDLPLNGRSYDELMTLNPGVVNFTSEKTGGTGVSNSTNGNNFAVSGNRPQQNLFLLNGMEYTGAAENNMQPGGTSGQLLGVDAVREFNVLARLLRRRIRQAPGRAGVDRHSIGHEPMARVGVRIPAQQRSGFAELSSMSRRRAAVSAQSVRRIARRAGPKRQDVFLRELRRVPSESASDVGNFRPGRGCAQRYAGPTGFVCTAAQRAACAAVVTQLLNLWPVANGPELTLPNGNPSGIAELSAARCRRFEKISARRAWINFLSERYALRVYTIDDGGGHDSYGRRSLQHRYRPFARTSVEPRGNTSLFAHAGEHGTFRLFARGILFPRRANAGVARRKHRGIRGHIRWELWSSEAVRLRTRRHNSAWRAATTERTLTYSGTSIPMRTK